ncbi:DUF3037 domain-containing protein [Pedobacter sp. LMG 31464]|uniref:DUF3037 domain-containing protein n=1 Tax=Pedobacter planticolens TaxID=2679964 RepID=A0A923DXN7_9SPHI|nr:DUF3037 domain-containing protein [Pedobacter planticolens]MBB2144985.1 DUF3037 domain-containing protein [Pedobacter planticolens]
MPEKHLFEYAVIRVVPRVEREEFLNVGVILYCAGQKFLKCVFDVNETRLSAFACDVETAIILSNLTAIEKICVGGAEAGPIGQLDIASRFRWLTATRSTVVQASKVHPGFCIDPEETLQKLFQQLVL